MRLFLSPFLPVSFQLGGLQIRSGGGLRREGLGREGEEVGEGGRGGGGEGGGGKEGGGSVLIKAFMRTRRQ